MTNQGRLLSTEDLYLIALSLRHERAQRLWSARRLGRKPKGIKQLQRLETIFEKLARDRTL